MKSNRTYISRAISCEMQATRRTQHSLAQAAELSQPTIAQILASPVRISPGSLAALTHCWPTEEANGRVLIAHLRDEICRAGHDPETALNIRLPDGQPAHTQAERDLADIRARLSDPDVSALIHDLAALLRSRLPNCQHAPSLLLKTHRAATPIA